MYQFEIGENEAGQRFDKYLHKLLPGAPSSFFYKMLRKKNIVLNGKKAEGKELLKLTDTVGLYFSEETFLKFSAPASDTTEYQKAYELMKSLPIIYENESFLILNKPSGVLSQKAKDTDLSANEWLIGYLLSKGTLTSQSLKTFKPSVCNRLDRNTSGLLICSKTLKASQYLSEAIRTKKIRKYYRLFVKGQLQDRLELKGYLKKDEVHNKVMLSEKKTEDASYIETAVYPIQVFPEYSYLEVELRTGKPHQIRAHLASIGHPLLMDYKYGDKSFNHKYERFVEDKGQLLHAYRLEFPNDDFLSEEEPHQFLAEEPADFQKLRNL